jgi:hypothetical protein
MIYREDKIKKVFAWIFGQVVLRCFPGCISEMGMALPNYLVQYCTRVL